MRYIQDPITMELVPADEYQRADTSGVFVREDYKPYQSQVTGEMIEGRKAHREHLRRHNLVEAADIKPSMPPPPRRDELREQIARQVYNKLRYQEKVMTITTNLTGSGISGLAADSFTGFVTLAQAATGAAQAGQTLPTDIVVYTTSTVNYGPTLPATAQSGDTYFVGNNSANSINVWPATGFYIGSAAQNAALAVGAGKAAKFIALGNGNWIAILSA